MIDILTRDGVLALYDLGRIDSSVINRIFDERDRLQKTLEDTVNASLIGLKVRKKTGKPFKSTFKVNTIKGIVKHDITKLYAYTFEEDDSTVEVRCCKIVQNE